MVGNQSRPGGGDDGVERGQTDSLSMLRRRVLELLGAGATVVGTVAADPDRSSGRGSSSGRGRGSGGRSGGSSDQGSRSRDSTDTDSGSVRRVTRRVYEEYRTRVGYSRGQLLEASRPAGHESNDRLVEGAVVAKFGKSLAHDDSTGLPTVDAYGSLASACETGEGFDGIEQADLGNAGITPSDLVDGDPNPKPLVQPETAWTYLTEGASTAQLEIAVPPAFDSDETGAEMVELYWRALTRDVNFHDYDSDPVVAAAAAELDGLDAYEGPGADTTVTPSNVFRGVTPGATTGPYVSQFLLKDRNLGGGVEDQKIEPQAATNTPRDYVTTVEDWLKVQKGVVPAVDDSLPGNEFSSDRRYIVTGRDMCERVHDDPPFRQLQKAAQVLVFTMNAPLDPAIPYTLKPFTKPSPGRRDVDSFTAQTTLPFNDFGPLYVEKKVLEASEHGQKAAWHKKWNVHRRLRPEEYGGRVQAQEGSGLDVALPGGYPIPDNLLDSEALARTEQEFGTYLLPQAYAEGSPTHPSYPAGHSVVAGAGVTVLKALFDGDYEFPADQKVVPTYDGSDLVTAASVTGDPMGVTDTLTVRGELNKLASNMALGRNRAGIHYRTDGIEGLRLGEAAAIRFVEDQLSLPEEVADLAGGRIALTVETFDGETRTITPTV